MKKILSVVFILLGAMASYAETYYYIRAGKELSSSSSVSMMYISGSKGYCISKKASEISSQMYSNRYYWDNYLSEKLLKASEPYKYDPHLSTGSYKVYKSPWRGQGGPIMVSGPYGYEVYSGEWGPGPLIGYYYRAISSDGKTIISWKQRKGSDEVLDKIYYEVIDPSSLNKDPHDFLR